MNTKNSINHENNNGKELMYYNKRLAVRSERIQMPWGDLQIMIYIKTILMNYIIVLDLRNITLFLLL